MNAKGKAGAWILPDKLWSRMEKLLPRYVSNPQGGRLRVDLRSIANSIIYVLRTGCQWKAVPREFGSGSTLHRYFQNWVAVGMFQKLWKASLLEYGELKNIQWNWQSVDGAMTRSPLAKSPLGGGKYRQKSDRSWQVGYPTFHPH